MYWLASHSYNNFCRKYEEIFHLVVTDEIFPDFLKNMKLCGIMEINGASILLLVDRSCMIKEMYENLHKSPEG